MNWLSWISQHKQVLILYRWRLLGLERNSSFQCRPRIGFQMLFQKMGWDSAWAPRWRNRGLETQFWQPGQIWRAASECCSFRIRFYLLRFAQVEAIWLLWKLILMLAIAKAIMHSLGSKFCLSAWLKALSEANQHLCPPTKALHAHLTLELKKLFVHMGSLFELFVPSHWL